MNLAERVRRGRQAIKIATDHGLDTSEWERHLAALVSRAGREPADGEGFEPWALWEWRRSSIPDWRNILEASIEGADSRREDYARWMLREVLLDPEYDDREI